MFANRVYALRIGAIWSMLLHVNYITFDDGIFPEYIFDWVFV